MPLKNQAKLTTVNQWASFHSMWSSEITRYLNHGRLPVRFEAKPSLHVGTSAEIDIATVDESGSLFAGMNGYHPGGGTDGGGVATLTTPATYIAPAATLSADGITFTDLALFEVQVFADDGWTLVAAIELVSPSNKTADGVETFAIKCASLLQGGVSVAVVDLVPAPAVNLHDALCELLGAPESVRWQSPSGLFVTSYRTKQTTKKPGLALGTGKVTLDVWATAVGFGDELPTVPLWLTPSLAVPLELESTYTSTLADLRIH